jgi:radical SAM protein with 4Fe4S-binding SPASM domain
MLLRKFGFDIVHGCQLRCVGCPNSVLQPKIQRISIEDFALCLKQVDVEHVHLMRLFNFGEPLLHHDLPGVVAQVPEAPFGVDILEISTNAQHHDFDALEETFKLGVLSRLVVSCDGEGTPEEYERLRTPAKWEKLLIFLETARRLRDSHSPGMKLITRTICTSEEGQKRWRSLLEPLGWEPEFRGWLKMPESSGTPWEDERKVPKGLCEYLQYNTLYVDADGTVVPCCVHPKAAVLGNLKQQKFSEIYKGAERAALVKQLKRNRTTHPICGKCEEGPKKTPLQRFKRSLDKRFRNSS